MSNNPLIPGPDDFIRDYDVNYDNNFTHPVHTNEKQMRFYKNTTAFSHVLGNITSIIKQYIYDMMPKNYFKGDRVTTEVAYKDYRDRKRNFIAKEKPFLVIDPSIIMNQETDALPWSVWDRFVPIDHTNSPYFALVNNEYFFHDEENDIRLGYTIARHTLRFGITMLVSTKMQRLSLENELRSNFRFKHMFPIRRYTETMIPHSYISYLADKYQMDIKSPDFLRKLNSISQFTILALNRPATDKIEFFVLNMQDLQIKIPDYPDAEQVMRNRVEDYSKVTFDIEVQVNIMNNFTMLTIDSVPNTDMMSDYMVRVSVTSRVPEIPSIWDKKSLYYTITCEFDESEDEIDLNNYTSYDTKPLIKYIQDNQLKDDYVGIRLYKWQDEVDNTDNQAFEFDSNTYKIKLKGMQKDTVYNISMYFDMSFLARIKTYVNPVNMSGTDFIDAPQSIKPMPLPSPYPRDDQE